MTTPRIMSVNVGSIRLFEWQGEIVTSAIWKSPVDGRTAIRGVNFVGDDQSDRRVHGGPDKAVYAYAWEDYEFWRTEENVETMPGLFGENLTTEGIDLSESIVGERWHVGSSVLEIAQPRLPCYKLGMRMRDSYFPRRFQAAMRMGAYLRVVSEGDVAANDPVSVVFRPDHGITLRAMTQALHDREKAAALGAISPLPEFWRRVSMRDVAVNSVDG